MDFNNLLVSRDENALFLMAVAVDAMVLFDGARHSVLQHLAVLPGIMAEAIAQDEPVLVQMILPSLTFLVKQYPQAIHRVKVLPSLIRALSRFDLDDDESKPAIRDLVKFLSQGLEYFEIILVFKRLETISEKVRLCVGALAPFLSCLLDNFSKFEGWHLTTIFRVIQRLRTEQGYLHWADNDEEENLLLTLCLLCVPNFLEFKELRSIAKWLACNNIISSVFWNQVIQHRRSFKNFREFLKRLADLGPKKLFNLLDLGSPKLVRKLLDPRNHSIL